MDPVGGKSNGRGRGRGRGAGGRGGRGRGRGRGDSGPRIGERITFSDIDGGFVPPTAPVRNAYRNKVQTGTEEILGNVIVPENDFIPSSIKAVKKDKKIIEATPPVSDEDVDMEDYHVDDPGGIITQIHVRPLPAPVDKKPGPNGYMNIWDRGLHNRVTRYKADYVRTSDKWSIVQPIPRPQAAHYLNKFAKRKIALIEPQFKKLKPQPPMTFTSQSVYQQFRGTIACSKVAGRLFAEIFNRPHMFNNLLSIQLPNSIKTLTTNGCEDLKDIQLAEQNVSKHSAENDVTTTSITKKQRYQCLTQFSSDEPFGKIQLLKSGRVILRIGNRTFDICMSAQDHDTHVGGIFENQTESDKPQAAFSNRHQAILQDNFYLLGKVQHFFATYYDYQKILKESNL